MPHPTDNACLNGHPYTEDNTGFRAYDGRRECLICKERRQKAKWKARKKRDPHRRMESAPRKRIDYDMEVAHLLDELGITLPRRVPK